MSKLTKNQKAVAEKVEAGKLYTLAEATALVKEITLFIIALIVLMMNLLLYKSKIKRVYIIVFKIAHIIIISTIIIPINAH